MKKEKLTATTNPLASMDLQENILQLILKNACMNCAEARHPDLFDYLDSIGFYATKIGDNHHWDYSPFRNKKALLLKSTEVNMSGMITEWVREVA